MSKIRFFIFCSIIFCGLSISANAADFTVSVDKNVVTSGDSLDLSISYSGSSKGEPDISALKDDFDIVSSGTSFNTTIINGQTASSKTWNYGLFPKKNGTLTIPSIEFAGEVSNEIKVKVVNSSEQIDAGETPPYFIKTEVDNNNPYVQQNILYKVKIYDAVGLEGPDPVIADSNDFISRLTGQATMKKESVNGKLYRVITYKYIVAPQRSGKLTLPQVVFNGQAQIPTNRRNMPSNQDMFNDMFKSFSMNMNSFATFQTKRVRITGDNININVKAVPSEVTGDIWMPADDATLAEAWNPNQGFKQGEPITRTIALKVTGLADTQLPNIDIGNTNGLKQYPEPYKTSNDLVDDKVVSVKQFNIVYIPEVSGSVTIPAVNINWWNLKEDKLETVSLPSHQIEIIANGSTNTSSVSPQSNNTQDQANKVASSSNSTPEASQPAPLSNAKNDSKLLKDGEAPVVSIPYSNIIYIAIAFVGGCLIMYIILSHKLKNQQSDTSSFEQINKAQSAKELRDAILAWGKNYWSSNPPLNEKIIAQRLSSKHLEIELDKLSGAIYGGNSSLNTKDLSKIKDLIKSAFKQHKKKQKKAKENLPPLYPYN